VREGTDPWGVMQDDWRPSQRLPQASKRQEKR